MGEKEPLEDKSETHGLCDECFLEEMAIVQEHLREAGRAGCSLE